MVRDRPLKHRCPACGHPVLPKDPLAILQPTQRAVFDAVYQAGQLGITRDDLVDRVWAGRDRTPAAQSIISVNVGEINNVNPVHIIPGTYQDNSDDAVARDLMPKGESHGMSKFTPRIVRQVYFAEGSISSISRKFKMSRMNVYRIKAKEIWTHILGDLP